MVQLKNYLLSFLVLVAPLQLGQAVAQNTTVNPKPPCEAKPEHRQLDFWLGEWDVTNEGQKVAASIIQRIIGGCVIFENYSQTQGFEGKSFTFYDSTLKQWRQTWVDNSGSVSEFAGVFSEGAMRLEGVTHRNDGRIVMRRMILKPMDQGRVHQFSQRSLDGGKTWLLAYDFVYVPKTAGKNP